MDNRLTYIKVTADDKKSCAVFESLMYPYIDELNEHSDRPLPDKFRKKWIDSIIAMQGPSDRHLELCFADNEPVGFLYGKVDHADHNGFIKPGYGYIMEFYVSPQYRRKGYGRMMYRRLEACFAGDGAKMMYLTADPVTGRPFWEAMGFRSSGERSPENRLEIYEKPITADEV